MILSALPGGCLASDAMGKAASGMVDAVGQSLADTMKNLMTFWIKAPDPDLGSGPGSAIAQIRDITMPLIAFAAIVGIIVAAVKMIRANADTGASLQDLARGLLLMVVTASAGASVVALLEAGFSQLAQYILDRGFAGRDVGSTLLDLFTNGAGGIALVIFGVLGIIVSAVQYGIMVLRGAILALLVGVLPIAAASAMTDGGMASFKKVCGWIAAFLLLRPAAAIVYATAFLMIGTGSSGGILFGMVLVVLSIVVLPALLRLMPSSAAAMGGGGGGGAMLATLATGSLVLAGRGGGGSSGAAASSATGSRTPGLAGSAGPSGGSAPASGGPSGGSAPASGGPPGGSGPTSGGPSGGPTAAGTAGASGQAANASGSAGNAGAAGTAHAGASPGSDGAASGPAPVPATGGSIGVASGGGRGAAALGQAMQMGQQVNRAVDDAATDATGSEPGSQG